MSKAFSDLSTPKFWGLITTPEYWYNLAEKGRREEAATNFGVALVLGHTKAPYELYKCFAEGIGGVQKDEYIANLMFGLAEKLGDPGCRHGIQGKDIRDSIIVQINNLYDLFERAHSKVPAEGIEMGKIYCQMRVFDHATKFLGKSIFSFSNLTAEEHEGKEEKMLVKLLQK